MRNQFICLIFNQPAVRFLLLGSAVVSMVACSGPIYKARYKPVNQQYANYHHPSQPVKASKRSVLTRAKSLLGKPYRFGGNHPSTGFDCSGFVQYTHASAGIDLPRTTRQQLKATHRINKQQLRPGDLVFFRINRKRFVSHVGIYLGNGEFIHSPSSGKHVTIAKLDNPYWKKVYTSAGRVF